MLPMEVAVCARLKDEIYISEQRNDNDVVHSGFKKKPLKSDKVWHLNNYLLPSALWL